MSQFLLRPLPSFGKVSEQLVDQLRELPGVRVERVIMYIVMVNFDGDATALKALIAGTAWDPDHMGENRLYRLQTVEEVQSEWWGPTVDGANLGEVLMGFAVEQDIPSRAHLQRYLAAFPQFRKELTEFALTLVEDQFHPQPEDGDPM